MTELEARVGDALGRLAAVEALLTPTAESFSLPERVHEYQRASQVRYMPLSTGAHTRFSRATHVMRSYVLASFVFEQQDGSLQTS